MQRALIDFLHELQMFQIFCLEERASRFVLSRDWCRGGAVGKVPA